MSYKMNDSVIARIAQIIQEGMLLNIDVVDLMRQIEVDIEDGPGGPELVLNADYEKRVFEYHEKLMLEADELQAKRAESVANLSDS